MKFKSIFKGSSDISDNDTNKSNFQFPSPIPNIGDARLNLREASIQNQSHNILSPILRPVQLNLDISDDLFSCPIKPLDESIMGSFGVNNSNVHAPFNTSAPLYEDSIMTDAVQNALFPVDEAFDGVRQQVAENQSNQLSQNAWQQVSVNQSNQLSQDAWQQAAVNQSNQLSQDARQQVSVNQSNQVAQNPQTLGNPVNPKRYFNNIFQMAAAMWIGSYSRSPSTMSVYNAGINNFIKFLKAGEIFRPLERDVINFYNQSLSNKGMNRAKSGITPITSFFNWASQNNIYPNICRHLQLKKIQGDSNNGHVLLSTQVSNPDQDLAEVNNFMGRVANSKQLIEIVSRWSMTIKLNNILIGNSTGYRNHVLNFIGYMKSKGIKHLSPEVIEAYVSPFDEKKPTFAQAATNAITKFFVWTRRTGTNIDDLL